jgi:putative transposase
VLAQLTSTHGAPRFLRSNDGSEFVLRALLQWLQQENIETALIDPGKPWQNSADESFNGKLRDECLSLDWFPSRAEARVVIENWRRHYNAVRPQRSLYSRLTEVTDVKSCWPPNANLPRIARSAQSKNV